MAFYGFKQKKKKHRFNHYYSIRHFNYRYLQAIYDCQAQTYNSRKNLFSIHAIILIEYYISENKTIMLDKTVQLMKKSTNYITVIK